MEPTFKMQENIYNANNQNQKTTCPYCGHHSDIEDFEHVGKDKFSYDFMICPACNEITNL
jgi:hypothetical protein